MNLIIDHLIFNHLQSLVFAVPFLFALVSLIIANKQVAKLLFVNLNIILLLSLCYGIYAYKVIAKNYFIGDWLPEFGIEFAISKYALISLLLLCILYNFFSIFCYASFEKSFESEIIGGRKHIPYSLFMLVEAAYNGIVLTNDIFNLYVFIEVASLASYALVAISNNRKSFVNAFDYLVIGTISATIILIFIGIILGITGNLNITQILHSSPKISAILSMPLTVLIVAFFIKLAVFPFYRWKLNSYSESSLVVTTFFISISVVAALLIMQKFDFLLSGVGISTFILIILGSITIVFGSYIALREDNLIRIVILSSISSAGYYILLWPFLLDPDNEKNIEFIFYQLLYNDSLTKMGLLLFALSIKSNDFSIRELIGIANKHKYYSGAVLLLLLNSASLPPFVLFFNKLSIISFFADWNSILVLPICIGSLLSTVLYLRIARQLFKTSDIKFEYKLNTLPALGVICVVISLISFMFLSSKFEQLIIWCSNNV